MYRIRFYFNSSNVGSPILAMAVSVARTTTGREVEKHLALLQQCLPAWQLVFQQLCHTRPTAWRVYVQWILDSLPNYSKTASSLPRAPQCSTSMWFTQQPNNPTTQHYHIGSKAVHSRSEVFQPRLSTPKPAVMWRAPANNSLGCGGLPQPLQ